MLEATFAERRAEEEEKDGRVEEEAGPRAG